MAQKSNSNASLEKRIRAAVNELDAKGETATNASVRAITGGSFRDITPVLKRIKAELEEKSRADRAVPGMPEDVLDAVTELWTLAWNKADETAAAERRGHAAEVDKVKADLADQEEAVAIVEDERDQAVKRAEIAEAELSKVRKEERNSALVIAELRGRLAERLAQDKTSGAAKGRVKAVKQTPKLDHEKDENQPDMFQESAEKPDDAEPIAAE
ncbi:DNA-binding protein [Roseovarius nanhaiticus]|uniref:DNA-binding protein n=1 Tax=Roseovarius nanhaiticus TaxID=573024 RepID=UPI002493B44A|nr:DNA-binding protein [Roseovarius nanhaiticus]